MKIYIINTLVLGISMTDIEITLKIVLLLVTILYTLDKFRYNYKKKNKK